MRENRIFVGHQLEEVSTIKKTFFAIKPLSLIRENRIFVGHQLEEVSTA
jgi:hypothetical protein